MQDGNMLERIETYLRVGIIIKFSPGDSAPISLLLYYLWDFIKNPFMKHRKSLL